MSHHSRSFLKEPPVRESLRSLLAAGDGDFAAGRPFSDGLTTALAANFGEQYLNYWLPGFNAGVETPVEGVDGWTFTQHFVQQVANKHSDFTMRLAALCFVADSSIRQERRRLIAERQEQELGESERAWLQTQSEIVPQALGLPQGDIDLYLALQHGLRECISQPSLSPSQSSRFVEQKYVQWLLQFHLAARAALTAAS